MVDYKDSTGGEVENICTKPKENFVFLDNAKEIEVYYAAFLDNALEIEAGNHSKQCECVLCPSDCTEPFWVLLVETKYANDLQAAFNKEYDYPNNMIDQIIQTVAFFRSKNILPPKKRVHAILSFPNLIQDFSESFRAKCDPPIEQILLDHQILIRPTNKATIKTKKRLKLS